VPNFNYKGRNQGGSLVTGQLQAASLNAAASDLFGNNITPIEITEAKAALKVPKVSTSTASGAGSGAGVVSGPSLSKSLFTSYKVDITDLIVFSRQMYSLTKAGMPLDRALRGLEASIASPGMKRVLRDAVGQLEKGIDLTTAFSRHPKVFSQLYLSLVHVGENTGRLDLAFEQIGKYLELERSTTKQIKSATRYPSIVIMAIAIALAVIMIFVIPVFAETFEQLQAELPWQTVVLINISDFFVAYWMFLLAAIVASYIIFGRWLKTDKGRSKWDKRKMSFPLVGSIFSRVALARFSRTFAMTMKAGVPVVQALGVIARAVGNKYVGDNILQMQEGLARGESLYKTAGKTGMFSPLVMQMIAVGEESGNVDELMQEVADFYDAEVEYDLKKLGSAIEPILIVFIAGMVLVLALGVFLPIWDLASAAR
jgi:MSHA biogenesis protein MshG